MFDVELTDLNSTERQRTEMKSLAALSHPHLVAVYDAHIARSEKGTLATGHTYRRSFRRRGRWCWPR